MKTLHNFKGLLLFIFSVACGLYSKAQYCPISFSGGVEPITSVDFAGITNTTPNSSTVALEDFTAMTGSVVQGGNYIIAVKGNTMGNYTDYIRVYIDWNQDNDLTGTGESYDIGSIVNTNGLGVVQASANISVPFGALTGNTRMRVTKRYAAYSNACNNNNYGQAEDYTINVLPGGSCTGNPVAGTASAPSAICPNTSFTLNLIGYTAASGIQIEWQYDSGSGWQPVAGATNPGFVVSSGITLTTSYRAVVSCSNGGGQDISNEVLVSVNQPTQCYCAVTFVGVEPITLVNIAGINNASTAAVTGSPALEDFTSIVGTVMLGVNYPITVKAYTAGNYTDSVKVYVDWNQNGSFYDADEAYEIGSITNSTGLDAVQVVGNILVPANALVGNTRMRVTQMWDGFATPCSNSSDYGQAEDYTLNVLPANSCLGTPSAGTAAAPATVCPNASFSLNLSNYTLSIGVGIQWQYYNTATSSWTDVPGGTTATFVVPGITTPTDYRAVVTCVNGGGNDISNIVSVSISPFYVCYCATFNGGSVAINNVSISGTTLNNTSGAASGPDYRVLYPATGNTTASLMQGALYTLSGSFSFQSASSFWIDYNQDGIFDASEWNQITTNTASGLVSFMVPPTALVGQTGMRVRARSTGAANGATDACTSMTTGETEDYIISIDAAVLCSGTPNTGTAVAPASICPTVPFMLSLSGATIATGISIEWQYYDINGASWIPLPGGSTPFYSVTGITAATTYRAMVSCSGSGLQAASNTVTVNITPANQCYCNIAFPGDVEPVTLVNFAGINNTSSDALSTPPELEDFTAITGNVALSGSYVITVKCNTAGPYTNYISAFIDWNQNGLLTDAGETYDLGTILNSTGLDAVQLTGTITVPAGALLGNTRLRVAAKWSSYPTPCNTSGYGQAEDYTLIVSPVLAITLRNISAANTGPYNRIDWQTASELKGDRFILERSTDGIHYTGIATEMARGEASDYSHVDEAPVDGINYYRLKLIGAGGQTLYSKTVTATVNNRNNVLIEAYPNPAGDILTIKISGQPAGPARVYVCDVTGKVLMQQPVTDNILHLNVKPLSEGVYFLKYEGEHHKQMLKINKL